MRRIAYAMVLCIAASLVSCSTAGQSPSAWLDQPIEGSQFGLEPVTLSAHASDSDGIIGIEFFVNAVLVETVPTNGERMCKASYEWTPEQTGEVLVQAVPIDGRGNRGQAAQAQILIIDLDQSDLADLSQAQPEGNSDLDNASAKQNSNCREGPDRAFDIEGILEAGESAPAVGKLADGSWILLNLTDEDKLCWIAANLLELPDGLIDRLPSVVPPPPPGETADPAPTPTPTPYPDNNPPIITDVSLSPDYILTPGNGCESYARTTTIQATVTDDVEVTQVIAAWWIGSESGSVIMFRADGNVFQGSIGPVTSVGTLYVNVTAEDSNDNETTSEVVTATVQNCIE